MSKRLVIVMLAVVLGIYAFVVACGGEEATETTAAEETTTTAGGPDTTAAPSGEPIKMAFDEGFTGFMAFDASLCEKGILVALAMLDNQIAGRPVEYLKADNGSDPVAAVDKARQLVESNKINYMIGPLFSPATQAVTAYLGTAGGIPQCSLMGNRRTIWRRPTS